MRAPNRTGKALLGACYATFEVHITALGKSYDIQQGTLRPARAVRNEKKCLRDEWEFQLRFELVTIYNELVRRVNTKKVPSWRNAKPVGKQGESVDYIP